jgi:hypothetical protein
MHVIQIDRFETKTLQTFGARLTNIVCIAADRAFAIRTKDINKFGGEEYLVTGTRFKLKKSKQSGLKSNLLALMWIFLEIFS